jgi:hypothetical protein
MASEDGPVASRQKCRAAPAACRSAQARRAAWPRGSLPKAVSRAFPSGRSRQASRESLLTSIPTNATEEVAQEYAWAGGYQEDIKSFTRILLECGILLYKQERTAKPEMYDLDKRPDITSETWVAVHPAFWPALRMD